MRAAFTWKTLAILLGVSTVVTALDWFSKQWAEGQGLVVVENSGISFGWFSELGFTSEGEALFWIPLIAIVLVAMLFVLRRDLPSNPWPFSFLVAGGVANLFDRIMTGSVRDWLHVPFATASIPVYNNLADWSITLALIWIWLQVYVVSFIRARLAKK